MKFLEVVEELQRKNDGYIVIVKNGFFYMGVVKIAKIDDKDKCLSELNTIDAELNMQRIYLRIMVKEKWIDYKKFQVSMDQIYEIGKILGGLIKYYAKDSKK